MLSRREQNHFILALLDYVSRGYEIEICPSVNPSVCIAIISVPNAWISYVSI